MAEPCETAPTDSLAALRREIAVRDEFIATAAHELRNPLSPLYMQLEYLKETVGASRDAIAQPWLMTQLDAMAGRLDRLLETLDRLLDASRLGAGHLELRPEPLDLVAITRGVVSAADRVLRAAACPLAIEAPDAVLGSWDRLRFEQILGNLVANAVRYGAGQPISIRIAEAADHVQLTVRDHGIGIAADDQQRVFQRFERGCNVGRTAGFGIGLWVAAELCRAMGGRIDVASELGSGAEFTVTLPRQSP